MPSIDTSDTFQALVSLWNKKTHPTDEKKANIPTNEDVTIASRIRPLLQNELDSGQVEGCLFRDSHSSVVDTHHLAPGFPRAANELVLKVNMQFMSST